MGKRRQRHVNSMITTCDIASKGVKMERYQIGGSEKDSGRVLTKFQVNLVIPEETYLWLYFNQGGDMYILGLFIIFLIRGGK